MLMLSQNGSCEELDGSCEELESSDRVQRKQNPT